MTAGPKYAGMMASLPARHREPLLALGQALGMSDDASLALALCRESLRDYCPAEEHIKVIAALFGLENRRRTEGDDK